MNVEVTKLDKLHIRELMDILLTYEAVFEIEDFKMADTRYLQKLLSNEQMMFFAALKDGEVIGSSQLMCFHPHIQKQQLIFIKR